MQAVGVCRAAAEAHVAWRIFFLKRLFGVHLVGRLTRSLPLSRSNELPIYVARVPAASFWEMPFECFIIQKASDTDALQFVGRHAGDPGYGRSAGPT